MISVHKNIISIFILCLKWFGWVLENHVASLLLNVICNCIWWPNFKDWSDAIICCLVVPLSTRILVSGKLYTIKLPPNALTVNMDINNIPSEPLTHWYFRDQVNSASCIREYLKTQNVQDKQQSGYPSALTENLKLQIDRCFTIESFLKTDASIIGYWEQLECHTWSNNQKKISNPRKVHLNAWPLILNCA